MIEGMGSNNAMACRNCGGMGCETRIARGLAPFCKMDAPAPRSKDGVFGTYSAAVDAAKPGETVVSVTVVGGPKRFCLRAAPYALNCIDCGNGLKASTPHVGDRCESCARALANDLGGQLGKVRS